MHTANVEVQPSELGTAPIQVVKYAQTLFKNGDRQKNIQRLAFEKIFAVFDRDDHDSYYEALRLADSLDGKFRNDAKQAVSFQAVASVPSFELWLLLHYEDIQAPIHRDEVMQRLQRYIPDYEKGAGKTFARTNKNLAVAKQRAELLATRFTADTDPEPFTAISGLVALLMTLRY